MTFISLIHIVSEHIVSIDSNTFILRIEKGTTSQEIRLKSYHAEILYVLFNKHPEILNYEDVKLILKKYHLAITDLTRLHRKFSEMKNFLFHFHAVFKDEILNTRGIGYHLSLKFKNISSFQQNETSIFKNKTIQKNIFRLEDLVKDSIQLTSKSRIIKQTQGYIIDRDPIKLELVEKIFIYDECEKDILKEIRSHEADFISLRVQYLLAKLKTYIGLARISDYPISVLQWQDWFEQEIKLVFEDLKKTIKLAEI